MDSLRDYNIQFVGLKFGKHSFTYHIDNKFFEYFQYKDFKSIKCDVDITLIKKPTLLEFNFNIKGIATLVCDITTEPFEQAINNSLDLIIKFGEEYNDDNEEIIILPHSDYQFDVSQYIYEAIVLALPIKRNHPGIEDGTLKSEVLEKLKEFEIKEPNKTDPRWDKLNELLTSKKP